MTDPDTRKLREIRAELERLDACQLAVWHPSWSTPPVLTVTRCRDGGTERCEIVNPDATLAELRKLRDNAGADDAWDAL